MDSIFFQGKLLADSPLVLAVVCDGVGSTKDGAFASGYATDMLKKWFFSADRNRLGLSLRDQVLDINRAVIDQASQGSLDTATTLSALLLCRDWYVTVHAGDSRIYRLDPTGLTQLTWDDVSPQGKLTACIGRKADVTIHYDEGPAEPGQRFFLCTDGCYKHLTPQRLEQELAQTSAWRLGGIPKRLVQAAIQQGETDNISAIFTTIKK